MNVQASLTPMSGGLFWKAFWLNMLWVNISGLPRYFLLIKPMLHEAYPNNAEIAPVSLNILLSWGVWTFLFVLASTCFFWMYFDRSQFTQRNAFIAALWFTTGTIGLTWLGTVNMGMVPVAILVVAMLWASIEQFVSAQIVGRLIHRDTV